jgi:hypothetical protein
VCRGGIHDADHPQSQHQRQIGFRTPLHGPVCNPASRQH